MAARKWIFVLIPVLIIGFFISARFKEIAKTEADQKAEAGSRRGGAASVEIATAQEQPIIQSIETVGTVTAEYTVNLSPRVSGRITYLEVREGETVKPGQLLARIDPSQADAGVLSARASINESRSRLAQAEATSQANAIQIEQAIQQARAEATYAKAALTQAQKSAEARIAASQATVKRSLGAITAAQADLKNRKAQVIAGEANLKNTRLKEDRTNSLYEKGYVSKQDLDNAVAATAKAIADLDVQKAEVEAAEANLTTARAQQESDVASLRATQATTEADIESAKARLAQANSALKTAEGNRAQLPANRANLNALKAGVDVADAQLKGATSQKSDTELRSTIFGTVTKRAADPGSIATSGQPLLTIESTNSIFVDANIPIDQSARIQKGDHVDLTIDGLPDSKISARVDQIVPSANVQDRQVLVRIRIQNQEDAIKPGMFAKVLIETNRVDSKVVIPIDAVKKDKILVITAENKAEERDVVLGERDENNVEVLSGLAVGERVVVLSFTPVKDGGSVTITAERRLDGTRVVIEPEKKPDAKSDKPQGAK
jgi:RND family efflux transporter MFP subunit